MVSTYITLIFSPPWFSPLHGFSSLKRCPFLSFHTSLSPLYLNVIYLPLCTSTTIETPSLTIFVLNRKWLLKRKPLTLCILNHVRPVCCLWIERMWGIFYVGLAMRSSGKTLFFLCNVYQLYCCTDILEIYVCILYKEDLKKKM